MTVLFLHRDHAPVRHFANHVLELDRGVVNAKVAVQAFFDLAQNPFAGRRRDVGD
jgi:ABC-type microcin C transport system duplicated ATPase subunit YejF